MGKLDDSIPITFLYGKKSKFCNNGGKAVEKMRKNVHLKPALNAGHHIQAEDHSKFNEIVNEICDTIDGGTDRKQKV